MDSWSSRVIWGTLNVIAGIEALTQGIDMLRTPVQSSHQTGWLGDAAFAMAERFGVLDQNDQRAFTKYWSFTMLGLSLGGAVVSAFLPAARATMQGARTAQNLSFLARTSDSVVDAARLTMVGIGRVVAEAWESIPRLRLRLTIARQSRLLERARKLRSGKAGILALRGGSSGVALRMSFGLNMAATVQMAGNATILKKYVWKPKQ